MDPYGAVVADHLEEERVAAVEYELYPRAVQLHAQRRLVIEGRRVRILP